jgi:hypothetical protein
VATAVAHAVTHLDEAVATLAAKVKKDPIPRCEVCGMDCEAPLELGFRGRVGIFDSFQCAIFAMALCCERCRCPIIGHLIELEGKTYCCPHCAQMASEK